MALLHHSGDQVPADGETQALLMAEDELEASRRAMNLQNILDSSRSGTTSDSDWNMFQAPPKCSKYLVK